MCRCIDALHQPIGELTSSSTRFSLPSKLRLHTDGAAIEPDNNRKRKSAQIFLSGQKRTKPKIDGALNSSNQSSQNLPNHSKPYMHWRVSKPYHVNEGRYTTINSNIKKSSHFSLSEMVALSKQNHRLKTHAEKSQYFAAPSSKHSRPHYQYESTTGSCISSPHCLTQEYENDGESRRTSCCSIVVQRNQSRLSNSCTLSPSHNDRKQIVASIQKNIDSLKARYQKQQGKLDELFQKYFQDCCDDCVLSANHCTINPSRMVVQIDESDISNFSPSSVFTFGHDADSVSIVSIESGDVKTDHSRHVHFNDDSLNTFIPTTKDTNSSNNIRKNIQELYIEDDATTPSDTKATLWYSRSDFIRFRSDCQSVIDRHNPILQQLQREEAKSSQNMQCTCQRCRKQYDETNTRANLDCNEKQGARYVRLSHHLTIIDPKSYGAEDACDMDTTGLERYIFLPARLGMIQKSRRKAFIHWMLRKQEEHRNRIRFGENGGDCRTDNLLTHILGKSDGTFQKVPVAKGMTTGSKASCLSTNMSIQHGATAVDYYSDLESSLAEMSRVFSIPSSKRAFRTAMLLHSELLWSS